MLLKVITLLAIVLTVVGFALGIYGSIWIALLGLVLTELILILLWMLSGFICTRFIDMEKEYDDHSPLFRAYVNAIIDSLNQLLRIKVHVTGKEKTPQEKFLLVCNHRSGMDPLVTMGVFREYRMGFVAKKELYKIPIISRLMHRCYCLCMNREDVRQSALVIGRAAKLIQEDRAAIGIYPEGTRSQNDEMLPFANGAFKVAKKAKSPILVTTIKNSDLIMKNAPWKTTHVYLDVLGVIDKEFVENNSTAQISKVAREMMEAHFASQQN